MTPRRARASAAPGSPVPASGAYVRVSVSEADSRRTGDDPAVQVRCFSSHHRLFDVVRGLHFEDGYGMVPDGPLTVERKCPSCKSVQQGTVTERPGYPFSSSRALDGPWFCECGKSLGYVDPIRGRVKTSCRCGAEVKVVAANAIAVASVPTRPVPEVSDAAGDTLGSFADVPV